MERDYSSSVVTTAPPMEAATVEDFTSLREVLSIHSVFVSAPPSAEEISKR